MFSRRGDKYIYFWLLWSLLTLASQPALATTEEPPRQLADLESLDTLSSMLDAVTRPRQTVAPREAYDRASAVLDHFGVPSEGETQSSMEDLHGIQSISGIASVLSSLDLHQQFWNYASVSALPDGSPELRVFQDRDSKSVLDYAVRLAPDGAREAELSRELEARLKAAARNPRSLPLQGLRIALDPGHMGGTPWDERAGKFVRDKKGRKLDEGLLVLQTALLLEKELVRLGATVMLTHHRLEPVTPLPYEKFDLRPYALHELRQSVPDGWFQSLLEAGPAGSTLFGAFESSASFRKLFAEIQRYRYYFQKADLDARVEAIHGFRPDLTLILHLDAGDQPGDPNGLSRGHDATKVYVPGGFFADEFGTRESRRDFGRHLLDPKAWRASVTLASRIVRSIGARLGVRPEANSMGNSAEVEPGVFARNLSVQRRITGSVSAYVEALYYNDPAEFEALLQPTYSMQIDGKTYPYSERLAQLVIALREGVLDFVSEYSR